MKPTNNVLGSRKMQLSTRAELNRPVRVDKFVVYLEPTDLAALMEAVALTTPADLKAIGKAGNHQGRAMAAIARQWLAMKEAQLG